MKRSLAGCATQGLRNKYCIHCFSCAVGVQLFAECGTVNFVFRPGFGTRGVVVVVVCTDRVQSYNITGAAYTTSHHGTERFQT